MQRAAGTLKAGGIVVAEVHDGHAAYHHVGQPLPASAMPNAPETVVMEIGSITKVFTGLLLAQTVLENKAALDDSISQHLPPEAKLSPAARAITLRQLATHTSGLPPLPKNIAPANPADPYADYTREQLYAYLASYAADTAPPQPAAYSNLGFGLLGHVLEQIHRQPFAMLVAQRITEPLGLHDTVVTLSPEQRHRFAPPHSGSVEVSPWHLTTLAGAGALRSTAADLARFALALLSPESPLTPAWQLARTPHADFSARQAQIGLGVFIGRRGDDTIYNHGGGTGGFRAHLEICPARQRATVVLANNDTVEPGALVAQAFAPRSAAPGAPNPSAHREETPLDPARRSDYPGVFALEGARSFTFVLDDAGQLRARLTGQGFLPVFHAGGDRFFARAVAAEFQFARDDTGKISRVTLLQNGRELAAKRTGEAPTILFPSLEKLRVYPGRYELAPGSLFEVELRGANLFVKLTSQPALPVFCTATDHFVYDVVNAALTFERDASGSVVAVVLHQHGRDQRAPRLP